MPLYYPTSLAGLLSGLGNVIQMQGQLQNTDPGNESITVGPAQVGTQAHTLRPRKYLTVIDSTGAVLKIALYNP